MKISELRQIYKNVRDTFHHSTYISTQLFDKLVKSQLPQEPTPQDYVDAALTLTVPCQRCMQTGLYVASISNGQPVTPGGVCYRCQGKGYQDYHDAKRNVIYDLTQTRKVG